MARECAKNPLGTLTPEVPVVLYNSPLDDIVPYAPAARLRDEWRRRGAGVTFHSPNTGGHGLTGVAMQGVATGWVSARLLGAADVSPPLRTACFCKSERAADRVPTDVEVEVEVDLAGFVRVARSGLPAWRPR